MASPAREADEPISVHNLIPVIFFWLYMYIEGMEQTPQKTSNIQQFFDMECQWLSQMGFWASESLSILSFL